MKRENSTSDLHQFFFSVICIHVYKYYNTNIRNTFNISYKYTFYGFVESIVLSKMLQYRREKKEHIAMTLSWNLIFFLLNIMVVCVPFFISFTFLFILPSDLYSFELFHDFFFILRIFSLLWLKFWILLETKTKPKLNSKMPIIRWMMEMSFARIFLCAILGTVYVAESTYSSIHLDQQHH